ncbi:ExeM/NucH family extracellular endonuclease [Spirosoma spitsbergense]|uniref:ExeM/NucH family extracellular endonuclease n=1 Tax=Spirosoma spitsbergense TaxID=431554 RepID=UPI00037D7409|nr:ExeM/NucH family extracellular endonuclease [Spirosoma spitsbergense]
MNQQLRAVSRLWLLFAAFLFAQGTWAQVSLTTINSPYTQDFNTLSNTAGSTTNTTLPTGFFLTETGGGARDNEQYAVDTGSSTTGDTYSYGAAAATDRAFGGLRSGTLIPVIGAAFTNNTGTTITSLSITYTGEEWRLGTASRSDRLDFQYSTNATDLTTGTYVDVDELDFSTPNQTTTGAKDGNAASNRTVITNTITSLSIAPGATFWIRFNDLDATGADDGLAIDDFSITPISATPVATFTASPTALTGFVATQGAVSPAQTYTITGSNLDGNPVSVSATANIELSTTMGGTYTPTLSIPATTSAISQEIFARLTATAPVGPLSGTITNTANTTLTAAVTVSGQVNDPAAPALSASPTTLSGFSTPQGTPSAEQSYTLTAANLTAAISVSAPAGVEVSSTTGSGFGPTFTLPASTTSAVVYVRLNSAAATTINGIITNVSGSQTANVAVSGTVSSTAPVSYTLISQIQGSGSTAALTGTQTIEAIVTRTFLGATQLNGFYVQEEDTDSDGNPLTSEGIYVYDPSGAFAGNPGDKVRITGAVTEFTTTVTGFPTSSLTEITLTGAANLTTVSTGNPLPAIVNVQLPVANVSDLERYEGMLINVSAASGNLAVTEYFQLGRYGQVVLSATGATDQPGTDARLDQYTQFFAPSVSGYATYLAEVAKRRIYLDDGRSSQNPDPIIFGRGGQPLSASNTLRGGDQLTSITAILDERSEGYRLQTANGTDANFIPSNPRPATPPVVGGSLKAGSFNVLNYFNTFGTTSFSTCSGNSIAGRGADNQTEFTRQRDKIIGAIINSGVDVMGLNEMQNNGFGTSSAIQDLVNGLNAVAGANSYTYVNSGCISTDAITVAMIYKPAKVTPVGSSTAIPFSYGTGSFTDVGRRALAQTFQDNTTNGVFTLVANHWKSKGSSAGGAGDTDINDGQSASNGTRTRQAQDLVSWLATNPTGTTDPDYLIVGDLNAYAKEDPLTALESGGYTNLVPNTTYSYVFDGFVGALDHALRSSSLQSQIAGADKWHINSDEPSVLDYNTNFKTAGQIASLYSAEPYRASDHDPVIVGLNLTPPTGPLALTFTASPTMLTTSGTTTLSATVSGGTSPYSYTFTGPGTITPSGNTASVSGIPAGVQTFTVVASDATAPTSQTISGTVSVTVTQANTAPVATANANQTATVGVAFSYTVNAFTDAETPNSLTYTASINPANGLSFDANSRVISGTPSMSGVSSVTVTATDPGSLSASTSFTITVSPAGTPPPTATFSITGVTTVSCETISAGQRRVTFTPRYAGLNGSPVSFSVVNELLPTTNPGPYTLNLYTDNSVITLQAVQSGASSSFAYNWLAACSSSTANTPPTVANPVSPQSATVGIAYTLSLANVFTDAETPNALVLSVTGLPAGLNFVAPSTISGTPSMSGVSTVTVTATDPGSLSASTSFTITVSPAAGTPPPPTGAFSITSVQTISCEVLSAGQRRLTFNPRYAGLNGSPVSFSVVNELLPTTNPGPYTLDLYTDNSVITLQAVQSGISSSFAYNWLAVCSSTTANTAPTVANPVSPQSATVGVAYTLSLANVFTDAETPNQLTLAVSGLPAGLSFTAPSTISGTPSMSGVTSVLVTATDPGSMSASTSFSITVNPAGGTPPPPTGTFSITGVTTVSCEVLSAGQRRVSFTPRYAGVDGSPVSFSVVNELLPTTNPGPYTLQLYTDNPTITLSAVQSGVSSSFAYNWLAACTPAAPGARVSGEPVSGLQLQVLGNPVRQVLEVAVTGATGSSLNLTLTDGQGRVVGQQAVEKATASERVRFDVNQLPAGVLILRANTSTQSQTVKVIKAE